METNYKDLIVADQNQNRERATNLPILDDAAKKNIAEACKYSSYFPNPITTPFMRKYILSKLEFPTKESELAQSVTELNVRVDNLFMDAYNFSKAQLEVEEWEIKVIESEESIGKAETDLQKRKLDVEMRKSQLELVHKKNSLKKIELGAMARYKEAMGWKQCVEDIMQEAGYKTLEEVNWDNIRMGEMSAKIKLWGKLAATGDLEMTPSKFQAVFSDNESFQQGLAEGTHPRVPHLIQQARALQEAGRHSEADAIKRQLALVGVPAELCN